MVLGAVAAFNPDYMILFRFPDQRHGYIAVIPADGVGHGPQHRQRIDNFFGPPELLDGTGQAVEVGQAVAHFRGGYFHHPFNGERVVLPVSGKKFLPDQPGVFFSGSELPALAGNQFRDFNRKRRTGNFSFTGQHETVGQFFSRQHAEAAGINIAGSDPDQTFAAGAFAAARGVNVDPGLPGTFQQVGAGSGFNGLS